MEEKNTTNVSESGNAEAVVKTPKTGFMGKLDNFFKLEENKTKLTTEILAGVATFFTMAYIIFVNPDTLSKAGTDANPLPWAAVFLATIIAAIIGTLIMGLFANVPYAQAPGMGLNAFFTYTICFGFGFTWQAALAMVFICGVINIVITVTKIRKHLIKAIPKVLQNAIGAGIGMFIAYIGFINSGIISISGAVPALSPMVSPSIIVALFGVILTVVLMVKKVKGSILIGIVSSTVLAVIFSAAFPEWKFINSDGNLVTLVDFAKISFSGEAFLAPFTELPKTFGAAFTRGMGDLFADMTKLPLALGAIFAFSLTDTFDTIGTFIGTGRRTGIFSEEDEAALENSTGFKTKMDKALLADACATSIGAVFGTSNTTTYVESAAGIEAGGKTGLVSVVVAILFALCVFISPIIGIVPGAATAPALIIVGILMMAPLKEIEWDNFADAAIAFMTVIIMVLSYNISNGIAFGFIFYVVIKLVQGKAKEIHPIMYGSALLFVLYFVVMLFM